MGCLASNLGNEMSEHSENIRKIIYEKEKIVKDEIAAVMEEAQKYGEIGTTTKATDIVAFIEDAGKGAMTSMKEMQSSYPIDNFMNMVKTVLLK